MNGLGFDLNLSAISNGGDHHDSTFASTFSNGNTSGISHFNSTISPTNRTVGKS